MKLTTFSTGWQIWFAWYPVKIGSDVIWFDYVHMRQVYIKNMTGWPRRSLPFRREYKIMG